MYRLKTEVPPEAKARLNSHHTILSQLLYNRGIKNEDDSRAWLNPNYDTDRHDPFLMRDMSTAVERILKAVRKNEHIGIFSDYDCDGIPGAVILNEFLQKVKHDNITTHIPHRHYEGFGLSIEAVEKLAESGATLIITIDCGSSSIDAVARAAELKLDVIVTDHHEIGSQEPSALALLNPKLIDDYPFNDLCGSGVVFKLIEGLIMRGSFDLMPGWEKWLLDLVGVATIADMVPLVGENRIFAHYGLKVLRKSRRPGIAHLFKKARASQTNATEDDVGFTIGPRINAASRMDTPEEAFKLLLTKDEKEAGAYADHLEKLNNERKGIVAAISKDLKRRVVALPKLPPVLVFGNPDWRPSLAGLAAGKLADEHCRPAFIWGRDGNGELKGSCRSGGSVSVVALMDARKELFIEHGGHHASGGFTVTKEGIHTLGKELSDAFTELGETAIVNSEPEVDLELKLEEITPKLIKDLESLGPFGAGNAKPLFLIKDVCPVEVNTFGKTSEHTKLTFETTGKAKEAICFFKTPEEFTVMPQVDEKLSLLAHVEQSFFMNRLQTRLRIVDIYM